MTVLAVLLTVANLALTARIFRRYTTGQSPKRLPELRNRRDN